MRSSHRNKVMKFVIHSHAGRIVLDHNTEIRMQYRGVKITGSLFVMKHAEMIILI